MTRTTKSSIDKNQKKRNFSTVEDAEVVEVEKNIRGKNEQAAVERQNKKQEKIKKLDRFLNLSRFGFLSFVVINSIIIVGVAFFLYEEKLYFESKIEEISKNLRTVETKFSSQEINKVVISSLEKIEQDLLEKIVKDLEEIEIKMQKTFSDIPTSPGTFEIETILKKRMEETKADLEIYLENMFIQNRAEVGDKSELSLLRTQKLINGIESSHKDLDFLFSKLELRIVGLEKTIEELRLKNRVDETKKLEKNDSVRKTTVAEPNVVTSGKNSEDEKIALLINDFPNLANEALKAEIYKNSDKSFFSKIFSILESRLIVRSITPQEGDSLDAILSRAEYYLKQRNLKKALIQMEELDGNSADIFSDWIRSADNLIRNIN